MKEGRENAYTVSGMASSQQAVNNGGAAALQQASGGHYLGTILVA